MDKTYEQWYAELEEPARSQALANLDPELRGDVTTDSLAAALSGGFYWEKSPEGHDYWVAIHTEVWE